MQWRADAAARRNPVVPYNFWSARILPCSDAARLRDVPSPPCEAISTPPFLFMCEFLPKWLYRDCEARCHPFCLAKHRKEGRYVFLFRFQLCRRRRQNVINLIALLSMAPSWRFHLPLPLSLSLARSLAGAVLHTGSGVAE